MDKKKLLSKIFGRKELADYSYTVLFFLISSFFLIFAIKPALSIAFSLRRESGDLKRVNDVYEQNILKLVDIQANLERIRDKLELLETAVPPRPDTQGIVADIKRAAADQGLLIKNFDISKVDLKKSDDKKNIKVIAINVQADTDFQSISGFVQKLITQKRLKLIKKLSIFKDDKNATGSSVLRVIFETEGYYL